MPYAPPARAESGFGDAVARFRDGTDSPRELLERCIAIIEAREGELAAFVTLDLAGARQAADASGARYRRGGALSPVDGLPVGLKDVIETADMPTQCGSEIYRGRSGGRDGPIAAALRRGGAVIVGKTATTEFAFGRTTATRNPYDPARTPGTSSSGSAAAVGAGMLPVAIGTQLQSSVLRPASYCGHVGAKPTAGAIRLDAIHPFSPSGDNVGVHARALEDAWSALRFLSREAGPVPGARGLAGPATAPGPERPERLLRMYTPGWALASDAVRATFEEALARLSAHGTEIVEPSADPALQALEDGFAQADACIAEIAAWEMRWPFLDYAAAGHSFHERIARVLARAREITLDDYHAALDLKADLRARHLAAAGHVDGMIGLTAPEIAPIGLENTGHPVMCSPASCTGAPALSLPAMAAEDMPLGLQLVGFHGADARLFAHAAWVRDALPG